MIRLGVYLHYKKQLYNVIGVVESNNEDLVLYTSMYKPKRAWLRPKNMFLDYINSETKRFTYVDSENYYDNLISLGYNKSKEEIMEEYNNRELSPLVTAFHTEEEREYSLSNLKNSSWNISANFFPVSVLI